MNTASEQHNEELPPWSECEVFCINAYSGQAACGWRGKRDDVTGTLCPRCGCSTLLRIPSDRADS